MRTEKAELEQFLRVCRKVIILLKVNTVCDSAGTSGEGIGRRQRSICALLRREGEGIKGCLTCPMTLVWCVFAPYLTCLIPIKVICSSILIASPEYDTSALIISKNLTERTGLALSKTITSVGAISARVSNKSSPNSVPGQLSIAMSQDLVNMVVSVDASSSESENTCPSHVQSQSQAPFWSSVRDPQETSVIVLRSARPKWGS